MWQTHSLAPGEQDHGSQTGRGLALRPGIVRMMLITLPTSSRHTTTVWVRGLPGLRRIVVSAAAARTVWLCLRLVGVLVAAAGTAVVAVGVRVLVRHDQRSPTTPGWVVFCLVLPCWPCSPVLLGALSGWISCPLPPVGAVGSPGPFVLRFAGGTGGGCADVPDLRIWTRLQRLSCRRDCQVRHTTLSHPPDAARRLPVRCPSTADGEAS